VENEDILGQIPSLRRYARALTRDVERADDLVQDCLERYRELNQALQERFAPVLREPVPERLLRTAPAHPRWRLASIGAAVGWMIVGGLAGSGIQYQLTARETPTVVADLVRPAAFAHVVYTSETRHPVDVAADQEEHLVQWLSKRLHTEIRAPNLSAIEYHLVGGRLLPSTNRMAAQFMYEDRTGHRITLYVRTGVWENQETAFRYAHEDGVGVFYWIDGTMGYAVSGEVDKPELLRIATTAYRELDVAVPEDTQPAGR
jgi:anti-sigma factor RsiW